jgi:hypothetical protein
MSGSRQFRFETPVANGVTMKHPRKNCNSIKLNVDDDVGFVALTQKERGGPDLSKEVAPPHFAMKPKRPAE